MKGLQRADTVFWGLCLVFLGHVPLFYETPVSPLLVATWYVAITLLGVLTIAEGIGYPPVCARSDAIRSVSVFLSGVGCAVATVFFLSVPESTLQSTVFAALSGCAAVVLLGASLKPLVWARLSQR